MNDVKGTDTKQSRRGAGKKTVAAIAAIVFVLALLLGGAFAWRDFAQSAMNRLRGGSTADVLLHDDFSPWDNKDVYVENTGDQPLIVRVLFEEYFQIGNKVLVPATGGDINDSSTYAIHLFGGEADITMGASGAAVITRDLLPETCEYPTHEYFQWELGGEPGLPVVMAEGKYYLRGTSELGNHDYEAMMTQAIADAGLTGMSFDDAVDNPNILGPNGLMFGKTLDQYPVFTIEGWMKLDHRVQIKTPCWILDTDGWAYWSQLLQPGEATNLLLDNVTMIKKPSDNFQYIVDVQLQAVNPSEWRQLTLGFHGLPVMTNEARAEIVDLILDEEEDIDFIVNVGKPIDVQLAVGMSNLDYKGFESELRSLLSAKSPPVSDEDLAITTGTKVAASDTTAEFSWWTYDHTRGTSRYNSPTNRQVAAIFDNVDHIYVENDASGSQTSNSPGRPQDTDPNQLTSTTTGSTYTPPATAYGSSSNPLFSLMKNPDTDILTGSVHPYQGNYRHMIESNSGATMDFYGYGQYSYKDFTILPNDEKNLKTFEFAIAEDLAYDALDGAGFFFNVDIYGGNYGSGQMMRGYLLFLRYDPVSGSTNFGKGVEMVIYKFNNVDTKNFHHTGAVTTTAGGVISGLASFTKVASSTVYAPTDFSRKIKIEVAPNAVRVWYLGSPTKNNAAILNVPIPEETLPVTWTMTTNGTGQANGSLQTEVNLDTNFVSKYGFGPMASYAGHGCARPTHMTLKNLTMTMERPRPIVDVLEETIWDSNNQKFIVNLNEELNPDFGDPGVTADILANLYNNDIYYISWNGNTNNAQSQTFLSKYENNGSIVNIDTLNHQQQMQAIADAIYAQYWQPNVGDTVVTTDKVVFEVIGVNRDNTADAHWPMGKWSVKHRIDGIDNHDGVQPWSGHDMDSLAFPVNKPGYYDIYYKDKLYKTIISHRAPVASFTVSGGNSPVFNDTSYDPDQMVGGIKSAKWSYIDLSTTATSYTSGKPTALSSGHTYLVKLEVADKQNATAVYSEKISN